MDRTIRALRQFLALLLICLPGLAPVATSQQSTSLPLTGKPGQSVTALPDGKFLLIGGVDNGTAISTALLFDPRTAISQTLTGITARAYHTATLLPDGQVFIWGGIGADGVIRRDAQVFDPATATFSPSDNPGLLPRTAHSALLLTDGRVLVVGGVDDGNAPFPVAELWDPRSKEVSAVGRGTDFDRKNATATLLADGSVLVRSGQTSSGQSATSALIFNPESESFALAIMNDANALLERTGQGGFGVAATIPDVDAASFPPDGLIAIRFLKPVDPASVNATALTLVGPGGEASARVIPSQDGMLAFISPTQPLFPGSRYTLFIGGVTSLAGERMGLQAIGFDTARLPPSAPVGPSPDTSGPASILGKAVTSAPSSVASSQPTGAEAQIGAETDDVFIPGPQHRDGRWRIGKPLPDYVQALLDHHDLIRTRVRALHMKAGITRSAPREGVTGVAGYVLKLNDEGLQNVEISSGGSATRTSQGGRFELSLKPGKHVLYVDGMGAGGKDRDYAQVVVGVDVREGELTELPHAIYLPRIRATDWVGIPSPTLKETVVTHPNLPGLEVRIPAGTVIRDRKGGLVTRVAIVPFPLDRAPFMTPANFPVAFLVNPMGAVVQGLDPRKSPGIRVTYPNNTYASPGTEAYFWMYDPADRGWFVYGRAQVSADGKQVAPQPGVAIFQTLPVMYSITSPAAPARAPKPGTCGQQKAGDPVELCTGLFEHTRTDVAIADVVPLTLTRTYRPADAVQRGFGLGTSQSFALYLSGLALPSMGATNLVLPNGAQVRFDPVANSYWAHTASPGEFQGAKLEHVDGAPYSLAGPVYVLTMKDGSKLLFSDWSAGAQLVAMLDRYGNRTDVVRSGGLVQRIASPSGRYIEVTNDGSGRITQLRDVSGRIWTYAYNSAGYLSQATYPDGTHENYSYDASNRMTAVSDRRGNTMVTNQYDANDRVTQQTLAGGAVYQFAYTVDANGNVTRTDVTDPRGKIRRVDFNSDGYKVAETFAAGTSDQQLYSYQRETGTNRVLSVTDPLNRVTAYTYDSVGSVLSITRLSGTSNAVTETLTYEPTFHGLATRTDPLSHTTTLTYDTFGSVTQVKDALNNTLTPTYNGNGQVATIADFAGKITQLSYTIGDLVGVTDPLSRTWTRELDVLGRVTALSDPLGNRTQYGYDTNDRVTRITDAHGLDTLLAYDGNGNLLSVTDANGSVHQYAYDVRNRRSTYTDPLGKAETSTYDGMDNLVSFTDRRLQASSFAYDGLNRRTLATYADSSSVTYTYDGAGHLTQALDSVTGAVTRSYDNLDRLTAETTPVGSVTYAYDAADRRTSMTVSGQAQVSYAYDNADRLLSIIQGTDTVQLTYDADGRRGTLTLPSGVVATYGYDDASQLTSMSYARAGTPVGDLAYTYDSAGRRTRVSGSLAHSLLPSATSATSVYDAANRLSSWNGATLAYDDNGSLTSDGTQTYTWDARNRLAGISGVVSAAFSYDALGRRLAKTVSGVTLQFVYDGLNPVQERSNGGVVANLISGPGIDEFYRRSDAGGARDFVTDALGSALAVADTSGVVRTSYKYEPYGAVTASGDASANSYQYTGRENDGTGLYYYRARYYHPQLQRFISEDPIGLISGPNVYAYVGGNPTNGRDPNGTDPVIGATVGLIAGAVQGYLGAAAQNGSTSERIAGAIIGGGLGAMVGALDPSLGAGTLMVIGGVAGGLGDVAGQGIAMLEDPCKKFNYGSTAGAVAAGAFAGYGTVVLSPWNRIMGEWTATTLSNVLLTAPAVVLPAMGADIANRQSHPY